MSDEQLTQVGQLTASIGYMPLENAIRSDILFERTDAALYHAKSSGRNCVKSYAALVEEGVIAPVDNRKGDIKLF